MDIEGTPIYIKGIEMIFHFATTYPVIIQKKIQITDRIFPAKIK